MITILDTNIFIWALCNENFNKIIKIFFSRETDPRLPFSLRDEVENQNYYIQFELNSILSYIERNKDIKDKLKNLEENYSNIYNSLKENTNDFKDKSKLKESLNFMIKHTMTITSWTSKIIPYPSDKEQEKNIMKKYNEKMKKLLKLEGVHNPDLGFVVVLQHYCSKVIFSVGSFISADKKFLKNKDKIESELDLINLITPEKYIANNMI